MDGDYDDPGPDCTLGPSEYLDSDDVRNDNGDVVVDAPNRSIAVVEHQGSRSARRRNSTTPDTATRCARRGGTATR